MAWIIAACLATLTITMIVIQLAINRSVMRMIENAPPLNAGEFGSDSRAKELSFETADGLTLNASLFRHEDRPSRGLILFCHELGGNRWSAMSYCEGLYEAGFEILSFDFRNHGASDTQPGYDPIHWMTEFELNDIRGALSLIDDHEDLTGQPLGLFGISRGAVAALAAASEVDRIKFVVCEGAYSTRSMMSLFAKRWVTLLVPQWMAGWIPAWHVEVSLAGGRIYSELKRKCQYVHLESFTAKLSDRQVLLISGQRDNYVRPEIAESLRDNIGSESADLWIVPNARHNGARLTDPAAYDQRLARFFAAMSPEQVDQPVADEQEVRNAW